LVDGYNVIFAWEDLAELARVNIDAARDALIDILCNYRAMVKSEVIVVFDAYRVAGHKTEFIDYQNIHIVYTQEAETADHYIEKFAHDKASKYKVAVVTSDGVEQVIIRGQGCALISSREFRDKTERISRELKEKYGVR
ncbi:MAG: NYN domain-containing protein, partial [Parasporobacterium sp.]|nr:NYN domain-containing protein [Parasporobacterium sp.]